MISRVLWCFLLLFWWIFHGLDCFMQIREYHRRHPASRYVDTTDEYEHLLKEEPVIEFTGEVCSLDFTSKWTNPLNTYLKLRKFEFELVYGNEKGQWLLEKFLDYPISSSILDGFLKNLTYDIVSQQICSFLIINFLDFISGSLWTVPWFTWTI